MRFLAGSMKWRKSFPVVFGKSYFFDGSWQTRRCPESQRVDLGFPGIVASIERPFARRRMSLAYSAGKACSERFHCSMNLSIISVPFSVQHPRSITMMVLTKISLMV